MKCGLNCPIEYESKSNDLQCGERKFAIWPDGNHYFKRAINDLVFKELTCFIPRGIIIVDFSLDHIQLFLDKEWIEKLRMTGLKIILVVEKSMLPMANFWMSRSELFGAVVVNNGVHGFVEKIKRLMLGRIPKCRRTPSFTDHEMTTLRLLARGHSNQDIALVMQCGARNVYRFQYSLRKKFGGMDRLRELRFRHAITAPG